MILQTSFDAPAQPSRGQDKNRSTNGSSIRFVPAGE